MPELPEVQSFASALHEGYAGRMIAGITLHRADVRFPLPREALERVFSEGATLIAVARIGKQLVLETTVGRARVSLGMSGAFFPAEAARRRKHEHVTIHFEDDVHLGFEDPRRFGFWVVEGEGSGPDRPTAADATDEAALLAVFLSPRTRRSRRSVKDLLMDQRHVAGVGNIYALEVLHRARLHPATRCDVIKEHTWRELASLLPALLGVAVEHGGSSVSTYRRLHGDEGGFQALHLVYGRGGLPCIVPGCGATIARFVQGGRSSFFCPRCQGTGAEGSRTATAVPTGAKAAAREPGPSGRSHGKECAT